MISIHDVSTNASRRAAKFISYFTACFVVMTFMVFNPLNVFSQEDYCFDQYFLENCTTHYGNYTVQCPPYLPGSPFCTVNYSYCILLEYDGLGNVINRRIKFGDYSYTGAGCSCIDIRQEILLSIFENENEMGVTQPGCVEEVQFRTDFCSREILDEFGYPMMTECEGNSQCCALTFTVCYDWACPTGNCALNVTSFTNTSSGTPTTECPVNCNSFCDYWARSFIAPIIPGKEAVELETDNTFSNKSISYTNGLLTIYSETVTREEISVEIYDLLGNLITSFENINLNKSHSIDVSYFSQGFYSIIIKSKEFKNAYKFIKY